MEQIRKYGPDWATTFHEDSYLLRSSMDYNLQKNHDIAPLQHCQIYERHDRSNRHQTQQLRSGYTTYRRTQTFRRCLFDRRNQMPQRLRTGTCSGYELFYTESVTFFSFPERKRRAPLHVFLPYYRYTSWYPENRYDPNDCYQEALTDLNVDVVTIMRSLRG